MRKSIEDFTKEKLMNMQTDRQIDRHTQTHKRMKNL